MSNVLTRILKRSSEPTCQCHWHGNDDKWICCWCGTEMHESRDNEPTVACWRRGQDSLTAWLWKTPATTTARRRHRAGVTA